MSDEAATTKRKSSGTDDEVQVSGITHAPDAAVAVNAADFHALLSAVEQGDLEAAQQAAAKFAV